VPLSHAWFGVSTVALGESRVVDWAQIVERRVRSSLVIVAPIPGDQLLHLVEGVVRLNRDLFAKGAMKALVAAIGLWMAGHGRDVCHRSGTREGNPLVCKELRSAVMNNLRFSLGLQPTVQSFQSPLDCQLDHVRSGG